MRRFNSAIMILVFLLIFNTSLLSVHAIGVAPKVISSSIKDKTAGVPLSTRSITVEFDSEMDATTLISAYIKLLDNIGVETSNTIVPSANGFVINFGALSMINTYTLKITTGVKSLSGVAMEQEVNITFNIANAIIDFNNVTLNTSNYRITGYDGGGGFYLLRDGVNTNIQLVDKGNDDKFGRVNLAGDSAYAQASWINSISNQLGKTSKAIIDFSVHNPAGDKVKKMGVAYYDTITTSADLLSFNTDGTVQDKAGNKSPLTIDTWGSFRVIIDTASDTYSVSQLVDGSYVKIFNTQSYNCDLTTINQVRFFIDGTKDGNTYSLDFDDLKIYQAIPFSVTSSIANMTDISAKLKNIMLDFDKDIDITSLTSKNVSLISESGNIVPLSITRTTSRSLLLHLDSNLDDSSVYKLYYDGVFAVDGSPSSDKYITFTTGKSVDYVPKVIKTVPANGATEVPTGSTSIVFTFNTAIDQTTLNDNASVQKYVNGIAVNVPFTGSYDSALKAYTVKLDANMDSATEYIVKLSGDIKDIDGIAMQNAMSISYTTLAVGMDENFNNLPDTMSLNGRPGIYLTNAAALELIKGFRLSADNVAVKMTRTADAYQLLQVYQSGNNPLFKMNGIIIAEVKFMSPSDSINDNKSIVIGGVNAPESALASFNSVTKTIAIAGSTVASFVPDQWFGMRWVVNTNTDTFEAYYSSDLINYDKLGETYKLSGNLFDTYLLKVNLGGTVADSFYVDDFKFVKLTTPVITGVTSDSSQINGASGISINPNDIKINFSENMDKSTMDNNNIRIYKISNNAQVSTTVINSLSKECSIKINDELDYYTQYKLVIENVKSQNGATILPKEYYFSTEKRPLSITSTKYTDANGVVLTNLDTGIVNINVGVANKQDVLQKVLLIATVYKDGLCVGVSGVETSVGANSTATMKTSITMPADRTNCTLQFMLWDGHTKIKPLFETQVFGQ